MKTINLEIQVPDKYKLLTRKYLLSILEYNKETGQLIWKINRAKAKMGEPAGCLTPKGYLYIGINGQRYFAHKLVWFYVTGRWPRKQIDHINQNGADNRFENLRLVTNRENHRNKRLSKKNASGHTGINWIERLAKWRARIMVDGKDIHLGVFADIRDAINARKEANLVYGFHENHGQQSLRKV